MRPDSRKFIFLLLLFLINIYSSLSQEVVFNYVAPPEQDPWYIVTSITQDAQGYMWFGGNGIHRYNGTDIITYRNDPLDPNSLVDNAVECLFADDDGIIWVGTLGLGLDRFDPVKNVFIHYRHQQDNTASLINDTVAAITKDREGNLWIGTHGGLERLDIKTGKFTHYTHNAGDSTSLSNNKVRVVYIDREDVVWVGTGDPFYNNVGMARAEGGLNRLNKKTNKFTRYIHNNADSLSLVDNRVRAICEDSHGTFWIGTAGDGLHTMDRATGKFKRYPYDVSNPGKLSRPALRKTLSFVDDHITFIKEDAAGFLWIGTMMGGVTRYDVKTNRITSYGTSKDTTGGFGSKSGWAAYSSRDGSFWISTWEASLYRIDPFKKSFPYNRIGAKVEGIYKESKGGAWICTPGTLVMMDAGNSIIKKYYINPDHSIVEEIHNFYRDRNGSFWILTNQGLINFDPQTEKFRQYVHDNADKKSLSDNSVYSIVEDHNMDLWVGTLDGLNKMDRRTGEFIHYRDTTKNSNTTNSNFITKIFEDRKNRLWVGTADGINLFDSRTGKFKNYLKGVTIQSILEDTESSLWAGGSDGLYRFNASLDSFISFPDPGSGLRFKNVSGISEDGQKKLWFYTSSGIVSINQQRDSSNSFDLGLDNINIVYGDHVLNGYNGEVFLSDAMGYYVIIPGEISGNFIPPQVAFNGFSLGEQLVMPDANGLLPGGISNANKIRLNYRQNVFSFDFDVLHFSDPGKNQSLFKLENYDAAWRQPGASRGASYFNVPPGHYIFRVKAASANGIWTEKNIEVDIDPPWWETWWFRVLSVVALIIVVYAIIKERSRKLKAENIRLEEKVTSRTEQLKKSLEELRSTQAQLIQSEKMASLGELTAGIAHEIQNPLNFVNNFSEVNNELIEELESELKNNNTDEAILIVKDLKENSEKINHHGKRADAIVKGMLQHSKASTGKKEPADINKLADEYLRLSYHGLRAKDKSFNADFKTDFDKGLSSVEGKINVVSQDIGRVLLNLYNNAFYAVNEKQKAEGSKLNAESSRYVPTVTVVTKKLNDKVEISVSDNGNGIPQNIVDKIFQPFFTTKPTGQGTGLGLSLSYDIIKTHGGEIKVKTKEGEGSEFIIQLPV